MNRILKIFGFHFGPASESTYGKITTEDQDHIETETEAYGVGTPITHEDRSMVRGDNLTRETTCNACHP